MKNLNNIFIVYGTVLENDLSNIKTINTKVIPNKDDVIILKSGKFKVIDRAISYTQVEDHNGKSNERGGESIYIFIEPV